MSTEHVSKHPEQIGSEKVNGARCLKLLGEGCLGTRNQAIFFNRRSCLCTPNSRIRTFFSSSSFCAHRHFAPLRLVLLIVCLRIKALQSTNEHIYCKSSKLKDSQIQYFFDLIEYRFVDETKQESESDRNAVRARELYDQADIMFKRE